jgi:hypothetical protein
MADRRTDDSPLAPRRPLGASDGGAEGGRGHNRTDGPFGYDSGGSSTEQTRRPHSDRRSSPRGATTAQRSTSSRTRTRRARLRLTHLDPWSVMKTSFLLSIAFGIVTVIAVAVIWSVLGAAGVWTSINQTVQDVIGGDTGASFDVENYVGTSRVMGFTMIVAVVDVILITAIATLGAFLYNLAAALLGGLEVTLTEDER